MYFDYCIGLLVLSVVPPLVTCIPFCLLLCFMMEENKLFIIIISENQIEISVNHLYQVASPGVRSMSTVNVQLVKKVLIS